MTQSTETIVEFGELPPDPRGGSRIATWQQIAAALRQRPGQWAKVATLPTGRAARSAAYYARTGNVAFRGAAFDFTTRGCDVWGLYIGEVSA